MVTYNIDTVGVGSPQDEGRGEGAQVLTSKVERDLTNK